MVGIDLPISARKGEEYLLDKRLAGIVRRTIFPCPTPTSKGILVIPTYDGTLMVGPTAHDVEDRDDLTTTGERPLLRRTEMPSAVDDSIRSRAFDVLMAAGERVIGFFYERGAGYLRRAAEGAGTARSNPGTWQRPVSIRTTRRSSVCASWSTACAAFRVTCRSMSVVS